jgi:hypothetical protein
MSLLYFSLSEKFAITLEDGTLKMWVADDCTSGKKKVFQKKDKKIVLRYNQFSFDPKWNSSIKDAEYCTHGEFWFGEFPYSSWAIGFRQCKITGEVELMTFDTEINPRGMTGQDRFRQDCQTYCPPTIKADFVVA